MKKILLNSLLLFIIAIFISCGSGSTAGGQATPTTNTVTKDLDNFFTVNFNNRTLTSYGVNISTSFPRHTKVTCLLLL